MTTSSHFGYQGSAIRNPFISTSLLILIFVAGLWVTPVDVAAQETQKPRVLSKGRTKSRGDRPPRGIKSEFGESGRSAGRGGKGLGKNIAKGRVLRAGKEFGKGMGGFGKHLGKGVGKSVKHAFKP
ncbi:MAG TPA: hypothetical protein PLL06_07690 [Acidobacteriota bacterium]|nr:hypothetical protein [Acidobacteriota bacterium]HMZ79566.1 hypothetical protein [Acidobacteriota bacterium]HNG94657.1 hypothetical protein [Acidobacteriota bacterium]HNH82894.1 hypothetical protein [Acidobacteriota bacterium]HNJ42455.1 hypothetical protein [Acidobacteriota bacterium]